ncbi:hypothetical protein TRVL_09070 [Trypanosoma vivax]|nr:hypothetical protein TRVL_09070 [Trypanosoma vivax]
MTSATARKKPSSALRCARDQCPIPTSQKGHAQLVPHPHLHTNDNVSVSSGLRLRLQDPLLSFADRSNAVRHLAMQDNETEADGRGATRNDPKDIPHTHRQCVWRCRRANETEPSAATASL